MWNIYVVIYIFMFWIAKRSVEKILPYSSTFDKIQVFNIIYLSSQTDTLFVLSKCGLWTKYGKSNIYVLNEPSHRKESSLIGEHVEKIFHSR